MSASGSDTVFAGSIPKLYEMYFVPMVFGPCASELVKRLSGRSLARVLEIAAGTGVVTRAMTSTLPESVSIIATDLNEAMLEQAKSIGTARPVEWRQADAMALPFPNEMFDAVICQFGVMFFPDKAKAFAEVRRVLRPGGVFIFNTWDRIEENEFIDTVTKALAKLFPDNPPRFHARVPHGYHDRATIARDLAAAGFTSTPQIETVAARSEARSPRIPAMAYCQGTPLRNEIEERDPSLLGDATVIAAKAIAERFGTGRISGKIQAHLVTVEK
jgi:SAM-dependent methyltransferase